MRRSAITLKHVHISTGISKLGADIPSVSLPIGTTCRPDAPCYRKCYARRGRFSFSRIRTLLENNLMIWQSDPRQYERDIIIAAFKCRFFRWHSAGDIPDAAYLSMMIRVARALPDTKFLAFTKRFELINTHIDDKGMLPVNLQIVFSAWGNFLPANPYNLPVAYIRFKKQPYQIPTDALHCPKYCGDCVSSGRSCWDLRQGQSVCFDEH